MKSFYARSLWAALGLIGLAQPLMAAEPFGANSFGSASLLPMPSTQVFSPPSVRQTAYGRFQEEIPSPSDQAPAPPVPLPDGQPFAAPPTGLSDYESAMKQSWHGSECMAGSCGDAACLPCGGACPRFYAYAGGLILDPAGDPKNRIDIGQQVGTYDTILTTADPGQGVWSGGVEARIGWILPNCRNAIEIGYWGIYPESQTTSVLASDFAGGIRPILGMNLDQVFYDDGTLNQSVQAWMTTTTGAYSLTRSYAFHNVEANFLGNTLAWGVVPYGAGGGFSSFQFGWLAGFRYFQLNEGFNFVTDFDDPLIGNPGDLNELTYHIGTRNTLLGFQMGGQGSWYINNRWSIYGSGRAGVFNNHVTSNQSISGLAGDAVIGNGAFAGQPYRFTSEDDALAAIGQIDLGLRYQWGYRWSVTGGYKLVGITGVATAPSQIPNNFADAASIQTIHASDSVILHGAYAGAQYAW